jgi:predicted aminopeptidase
MFRRIITWGLRAGLVFLLLTTAAAFIWKDVTLYLWQSVRGQISLLVDGRSIAEMQQDPKVPISLKQQFKRVADVKAFAEQKLGLKPTRNYEKYLDLKRDYLVMVLTASPPLKMESYTWWFPVVGTVPYKGYYDKEMGLSDQKQLQAQGLETHFRASPAYSTLGWFQDPLLSTMLQYGEFYLVSTVIHESVHATLWIPGDVSFNENLASFVGYHGALDYYASKYGKGSKQYQEGLQIQSNQKIFAEFIADLHDRLKRLYESDAFTANKYDRKAALIEEMKSRYRVEIVKKFKGNGYAGFDQREWNNAMIMAYRHYDQEQGFFDDLLKHQKNSIFQLMAYLKTQGPAGIQKLRETYHNSQKKKKAL